MRGRNLLFVLVLLAAFVVPYVVSKRRQQGNEQIGLLDQIRQLWGSTADDDLAPGSITANSSPASLRPTMRTSKQYAPLDGSAASSPVRESNDQWAAMSGEAFGRTIELPAIGGPPVQSVSELIRFDANPQWITANWKHVSTRLADMDLRGMRVPVVSGTNDHDVAGSLTYYFDRSQKLQRILLHGFTSDYRPLVNDVMKQHNLTEVPALVHGLLVARDQGNVNCLMRVKDAASNKGRNQYEVYLELNRAGAVLSQTGRQLIDEGRRANLW